MTKSTLCVCVWIFKQAQSELISLRLGARNRDILRKTVAQCGGDEKICNAYQRGSKNQNMHLGSQIKKAQIEIVV